MTVTLTARQRWQKAYSEARYWPNDRPRDEVLRYALWRFFGPAFGRVFSPTFDRHAAAAAAAAAWWVVAGKTCVAAYQPKGAASLAASYVNLANPGTYDAAPGVAPTLGADGWVFNGSTQYLTTGVVPANAWSMLIRVSGTTNEGTAIGEYVADARFEIAPRPGFGTVYGQGGALVEGTATAGVLAISGQKGYKNGVATIGTIGAWTAGPALAIYIGDRNGAASKYSGNIQALAIYSATLTAGEVATVSADMAAL